MNVAETIYEKINLLPDDKQQEVFDFIDFISSRYNKKQAITTNEELTDDIFVNFSMHHALRGIEDDPVNYSTEDLKERWL
jgi:hypothetical protein